MLLETKGEDSVLVRIVYVDGFFKEGEERVV